jgi:NitT/TauT family transport system ATP-binding protein
MHTICEQAVLGPATEIAVAFQTFALFAWLTVLQNVEIGREAQGVEPAGRHKRTLVVVDLIRLDGDESASRRNWRAASASG